MYNFELMNKIYRYCTNLSNQIVIKRNTDIYNIKRTL